MIAGWGGDWNDGYGFMGGLIDSRTSYPGSANLRIQDREIHELIDRALREPEKAARDRIWGDVDRKVMEGAFVLPGVWPKYLHFRPASVTNIFFNETFGMYDLTAIGTSRK
jgi:peptide/nickel transport system substrate-binding protein